MRPFGCHALYRPSFSKLPVFGSRVKNGLPQRHDGGGVYRILTDSGNVHTTHVRFRETEFPGMFSIGLALQSHEMSKLEVVEVNILEAETRVDMPKTIPDVPGVEHSKEPLELYQDV